MVPRRVYDGERDAEERSAAWAEDALPGLCDPATVAEVARLVRLTETHRPADDDANGCVLSDADLGILAAPPQRYAEYVAAVRTEYAHLDDATFDAGRALVLADLLAKPRLFHTTYASRALGGPGPRQRPRVGELRALASAEPGSDRLAAPSQPGGDQAPHQLARADRCGAGGDHRVVPLRRDVVVVAVEAPLGDVEVRAKACSSS